MTITLETQLRQVQNIPSGMYNPNDPETIFAEDHNSLVDAVNEVVEKVNLADVDLQAQIDDKADSVAISAVLDLKADKSTTYTKTEIDQEFSNIDNVLQNNADNLQANIDLKADKSDTYNKSEVDTLLTGKQNSISAFTSSKIDTHGQSTINYSTNSDKDIFYTVYASPNFQVYKYDKVNDTWSLFATQSAPSAPVISCFDNSGNTYYLLTAGNIYKMTSTGVITYIANSGFTSNNFGMKVDTSGNLYVIATGNTALKKITQAGVVTTHKTLTASPYRLLETNDDILYYFSSSDSKIRKLDLNTLNENIEGFIYYVYYQAPVVNGIAYIWGSSDYSHLLKYDIANKKYVGFVMLPFNMQYDKGLRIVDDLLIYPLQSYYETIITKI